MKKLFFVALAVVAIAAACNNQTSTQPAPTPTPSPTPAPTSTQPVTQTYSNATYGFTFDYPLTMNFVTATYPNLQDKIVQLQIPKSAYPGTNFSDGDFSVSAQFAKTLADCLKLSPPANGDGFKNKTTINGVDFYLTKSSDAGAGNLYESLVYRTLRGTNGTCLELNETIHTSNIANYPAGTVTEVNSADIKTGLNTIANTFKFQ